MQFLAVHNSSYLAELFRWGEFKFAIQIHLRVIMYILLNTSFEMQDAQQFLKVLQCVMQCFKDTAGVEVTRFDSQLFLCIGLHSKGSVPLKLGFFMYSTVVWKYVLAGSDVKHEALFLNVWFPTSS
jgi:hypothetical protein